MDPVVENVLVELLVDLPAAADVPVGPQRTGKDLAWSDLRLSRR